MKVVYEIPDFLEEKFVNMDEKDICAYITKSLMRDDSVTDRLCLDMRIDQNDNFAKIISKLTEIGNSIQSGVVVSAGTQSSVASTVNNEVEIQEEKYVALEVGDDEDGGEDDPFSQFIM